MKTKILEPKYFSKASSYVLSSSRALERNLYKYYFQDANPEKPLKELKNYQNPDGGFGHGLEPDLRLPASSPIATVMAFRQIELVEEAMDMYSELVRSASTYLENSFQSENNRWYAVSSEVNDYPHAPWWHYDEAGGRTPIDEFWGNPTVEALAYGLKYGGFSSDFKLDKLVDIAVKRINETEIFESEHEIYCYLKLYETLPDKLAEKIEDKLFDAVRQLVVTDPAEWNSYVPQPLNFVTEPDSPRFGISEVNLERNLNFLVETITKNGSVEPNWEWGQFESEWERAKMEWTGILTLKSLITLDKFGMVSHN